MHWSKDEVEILRTGYYSFTSDELVVTLKRNLPAIQLKARRLGLMKHPRWTDEEFSVLKENRGKLTSEEIAELVHKTSDAVQLKSRREHLPSSYNKYITMDFSSIDTEEKAYILGFISADGTVNKNGRTVHIRLQDIDIDMLIKIRRVVCPNAHIDKFEKAGNVRTQYGVSFHSVKLCNDLYLHGVTPNKSKTIHPSPHIPSGLIRHYIRGITDGDGHINDYSRSGNPHASITGSKYMMEFLKEQFGLIYPNRSSICKYGGSYTVNYSGRSAWNFIRWLYKDATIYLDRKFCIAKRVLDSGEPIKNFMWSQNEVNLLKENFLLPLIDLEKILPGRSKKAIYSKMYKLRLKDDFKMSTL